MRVLSYQTAWLKAHYPARVHGRGAVGRHGPHRQGRHADRRMPAHGAGRRAARRQRVAVHVHASRAATVDPLRARRDQGRRRGGGRGDACGARSAMAPTAISAISAGAWISIGQPARRRGADPLRRLRFARRQPRDADARAARRHAGGRSELTRVTRRASPICSGSAQGRPSPALRRRARASQRARVE